MQSGFGRWVLEHRGARIGLIAGLLPLPLTSVLSAALVVAVTIARGWRDVLADCAIALVVLVAVTVSLGGAWGPVVASGVLTWSVAMFVGALTGLYGSLTLTLQALIVVGLLGLAVFVIAVTDPVDFWERVLTDLTGQMTQLGVQFSEPEALLELAPMMSGLFAASMVSSSILALLIGAWWAGGAGGPSFREMFVRIRLGYILGAVALLAGIAALLLPGDLAGNALLVLGIGFVFQGLAVVHWLVAVRGLPWMFLIPVYLPFFMGATIMVTALFLLATVGFVDNWYGLRKAGADLR
jgi:hypothetical protein